MIDRRAQSLTWHPRNDDLPNRSMYSVVGNPKMRWNNGSLVREWIPGNHNGSGEL